MPEAAAQNTRPAPAEEAAIRPGRARIPEGAFRIIPSYIIDKDGHAIIGDVCDNLSTLATALAGSIERLANRTNTLSDDEAVGLSRLARILGTSFYDLDAVFASHMADLAGEVERGRARCDELENKLARKNSLIYQLRGELQENNTPTPRHAEPPTPPAGPDLTEPSAAKAKAARS